MIYLKDLVSKDKLLLKVLFKNNYKIIINGTNLNKIKNNNWEWESLLCPYDNTNIITISDSNNIYSVSLGTYGKVDAKTLTGETVECKDLERLLTKDNIRKYNILKRNKFCVAFFKKSVCIKGYVFKEEPKSTNDLIEILINELENNIKEYKMNNNDRNI